MVLKDDFLKEKVVMIYRSKIEHVLKISFKSQGNQSHVIRHIMDQ